MSLTIFNCAQGYIDFEFVQPLPDHDVLRVTKSDLELLSEIKRRVNIFATVSKIHSHTVRVHIHICLAIW